MGDGLNALTGILCFSTPPFADKTVRKATQADRTTSKCPFSSFLASIGDLCPDPGIAKGPKTRGMPGFSRNRSPELTFCPPHALTGLGIASGKANPGPLARPEQRSGGPMTRSRPDSSPTRVRSTPKTTLYVEPIRASRGVGALPAMPGSPSPAFR